MKTYRRILIPVTGEQTLDAVLHSAATIGQTAAEFMVLRVVDTRSGVEPDGPAGNLPAERAARKAFALRRRLELQLARSPLAGARARVVPGEVDAVLADELRNRQPDLIVTTAQMRPALERAIGRTGITRPDVLEVSGPGWLARTFNTLMQRPIAQLQPALGVSARDA